MLCFHISAWQGKLRFDELVSNSQKACSHFALVPRSLPSLSFATMFLLCSSARTVAIQTAPQRRPAHALVQKTQHPGSQRLVRGRLSTRLRWQPSDDGLLRLHPHLRSIRSKLQQLRPVLYSPLRIDCVRRLRLTSVLTVFAALVRFSSMLLSMSAPI